ncbi:MAG: hypothetical protein ACOYK2_03055 [Polynucleobacter sp.]
MGALFFSKSSKQFRGIIALIFLLASILGAHWIGFAHGISHSGLGHANTELSCTDQSPSLTHSAASCHLFDALTLAGFIASESTSLFSVNASTEAFKASSYSPPARLHVGLYQSRAPPTFIL